MIVDVGELLPTALRLAIALLLGSAIGVERQRYQKMAGSRTDATEW
jgi:putative Mg2+ transporter-C (MgtC) family protein